MKIIRAFTFFATALLLLTSCAREEVAKGKFLNLDVAEVKELAGLRGRVEVARDEWGVPHIYAKNEHDLFFAQGYLHAADRLFQMILLRGAAKGELALIAGVEMLPDDVSVRLFKFDKVAQEIFAQATPEESELLQAYADGVNAYLDTARPEEFPFELLAQGFDSLESIPRWEPGDSLAFARLMTFQLSFDNEGELGEKILGIQEGLVDYLLPIVGPTTAPVLAGGMVMDLFTANPVRDAVISDPASYEFAALPAASGIGALSVGELPALMNLRSLLDSLIGEKGQSNSWAISGDHTSTGYPMLANDPHLDLTQPAIFHEAHLNTKDQGGELNVAGVMFPLDPGIAIGFNEDLAWGETTVGYDVTDFYIELTTTTTADPFPEEVCKDPGCTSFADVIERPESLVYPPSDDPIDPCALDPAIIQGIEEYPVGVGEPFYLDPLGVCLLPVTIYEVTHGSLRCPVVKLLPAGELFATVALLTACWTGLEPSTEVKAFFGFMRSNDMDDFKISAADFKVGAQNHLMADTQGNIGWFPYAWIPAKGDQYTNNCINPAINPIPPYTVPHYLPQYGFNPYCEWEGYLPLGLLPRLENPAEGYIVTANNIPVITITNPTIPPTSYYHGTFYDLGYRASRIGQRITEKVGGAEKITIADMMSIQADTYLGPCTDFLATVLVSPTIEGRLTELTDPTLKQNAYDYLKNWDCSTPTDSVASSIFHAWYANFVHFTFDDQTFGEDLGDAQYGRAIYHITFRKNCADPTLAPGEPCQLTGFGQWGVISVGVSPFWDDISTTPAVETRDDIVLKAFSEAVDALREPYNLSTGRGGFGTDDLSQWLWGDLHTVFLAHLAESILNVPSPFDTVYPNGFPRPGGYFVVDSSHPGLAPATPASPRSFKYANGPSYRMVVDLTPGAVKAWTTIPGGDIARPSSVHYDDQMRNLWVNNKYKVLYLNKKDVEDNAVSLQVFLAE